LSDAFALRGCHPDMHGFSCDDRLTDRLSDGERPR